MVLDDNCRGTYQGLPTHVGLSWLASRPPGVLPPTSVTLEKRQEASGWTPVHTESMDEALWDNLDRLHKQRKWREKGVAERQAKRQRREDKEVFRPFAPSRTGPNTNNAMAGPSNTTHSRAPSPSLNTNIPPPPQSSAPEQPAPPNDDDAKMTDGEATEAAKRPRARRSRDASQRSRGRRTTSEGGYVTDGLVQADH
ncbi:uncharacterized protein F5147DRAFT_656054 [Suillus discolor]|uniref:Uncharacterized protein n=1 Tax=Suillus discolor TaxID=1912936 RepID=A0A9P7EZY0_9AGAM|nr:uncharacterized protein F5147DRAFT_656054 [Suillus discolor]KAG2098403.1 hypothetical protein F5147DRAFT_656054 [Suillus discolor]